MSQNDDMINRQKAIDAAHKNYDTILDFKSDGRTVAYSFEDIINALPSAQPEQQNARIFQGIIVEYPSISTYPEYEGKPYFSIKYTENGQDFIGYGTYKPDVLSEYLKKYFIPSAQADSKELSFTHKALDTISRKAAIEIASGFCHPANIAKELAKLPSAQPERKKGKWIPETEDWRNQIVWVKCSECGFDTSTSYNYCPNCGCRMDGGEQDE